jgi:hypothetical protein
MRPEPTRIAAGVWSAVLLGLAVQGFLFPTAHTVFDIYAPASLRWWAGDNLYAPYVRAWIEHGQPASTTEHYRYCPAFAVCLTPFAQLPFAIGNALWKAFNGAFLLVGLWYASRRLFPTALTRAQTAAFVLLALPVSLHSLYNGQANLTVVGAVMFGVGAAAAGHWNSAAIWLALATLVKGYPVAAGLLMSAVYPSQFALRYFTALAAGFVLPFAAQRPGYVVEQTFDWIRHMTASPSLMRERQRSIDHLLESWGYPITSQTFVFLGVGAAMIVLTLCLAYSWRVPEARRRLTCLLLLYSAWVALFGQATESCTYAVMAPVIAWSVVDAFSRPASWFARTALLCSLLMMGPLVTDMFGPVVRKFAVSHGSQPLGAALFVLYALGRMIRETRKQGERTTRIPMRYSVTPTSVASVRL